MIIVNIIGGLGNQMFQYAMGAALAIQSKQELKLDITTFEHYDLRDYELDIFNIDPEIASDEEIIQAKKNELSELNFTEKYCYFDLSLKLLGQNENVYLRGYWQSEKYFSAYKDYILEAFTSKNRLSRQSSQFHKAIASTNSVGLHVRRGDYITNPKENNHHGVCSLEYYNNAASFIVNRIDKPHFFIFSDDLDWAKESLDFIDNITFVELDKNIPDYEEMYLMSQCKHNIIANSSFSWWGAWLNQNSKKIVIAPKKWLTDETIDTKDLIPDSWIRLSDKPFRENDLVSIIIPCYNQAQYLEESVQSAVDQTYPNIEIIIVNDGSSDNTQEVAEELQKRYPDTIRIVTQENQGISEARNTGIRESLGEYILPLDSDDILDPKIISKYVNTMIQNSADIVYSDLQRFEKNQDIRLRKPFSENNILYENLPHGSSLYRKEVWAKNKGYKQNMKEGYEDWEFWINAYKHNFTFHHLPEVLFYYRIKDESRDTNAYKKDTYLKAEIMMNHPELYTAIQVQEAIVTIKETEELADLYFYYDKSIPGDEETLLAKAGCLIAGNPSKKKQIIIIDDKKIGLCTLELLQNNKSIQKLYKKMGIDFLLFYAPLRYHAPSLQNIDFAWDKDKGIVETRGSIFPFVFKSERENPDSQLLAYKRLAAYQALRLNRKSNELRTEIARQIKMREDKEMLIRKRDKLIEHKDKANKERIIIIEGNNRLIEQQKKTIDKADIRSEVIMSAIQKAISFPITKNPIQKYRAYKSMVQTYFDIAKN